MGLRKLLMKDIMRKNYQWTIIEDNLLRDVYPNNYIKEILY